MKICVDYKENTLKPYVLFSMLENKSELATERTEQIEICSENKNHQQPLLPVVKKVSTIGYFLSIGINFFPIVKIISVHCHEFPAIGINFYPLDALFGWNLRKEFLKRPRLIPICEALADKTAQQYFIQLLAHRQSRILVTFTSFAVCIRYILHTQQLVWYTFNLYTYFMCLYVAFSSLSYFHVLCFFSRSSSTISFQFTCA